MDNYTYNPSSVSNISDNASEILENETLHHGTHPATYFIATLYCIMLIAAMLSCMLVTYINYKFGFGSKLNNFLVTNWLLFSAVFIITGSILHTLYQSVFRMTYPFGLDGCMVTQFLETATTLPLKTIPVILCCNIYRKVFAGETGKIGYLPQVSRTTLITAGLWLVIFDCVLGVAYEGTIGFGVCRPKLASHVVVVAYVEFIYELLLGTLIPLIVIITIGVLTVRRTKGGHPLTKYDISDKLKVRQLILAVMGLLIICRLIIAILEFFIAFRGNLMLHWILSVTLALLSCHREFWQSVFDRYRKTEDRQIMLT